MKDVLVLWKPDAVPKRFYQLPSKLTERRVTAWPPGLFLQLQILQMVESEQVQQEIEHLSSLRIIPQKIFVERFIQKLILASMAVPSDSGETVGGRSRRESRNIFALTVALCQVLRNYTSSQARVILQAAIQSEDDRTDNAHSVTKGKIMNAVLDRFSEFLRLERLENGERRFEQQENSSQKLWQSVVHATLNYLSPWGARHVLEKPLQPGESPNDLRVERALSRIGWQVLANCANVLICQDCFANLTANLLFPLGRDEQPLPKPNDVLAIPAFYKQSIPDPPDKAHPLEQEEQEDKELEDFRLLEEIEDERKRVKKNRGLRLAAVVDDLPPVEHDLIRDATQFAFDLPDKATYLRIYARDGLSDSLIAGTSIRHVWYTGERVQEKLIGLGGQTVDLLLIPPSTDGTTSAKVQLSYYESFWTKRLALGWDRLAYRSAATFAVVRPVVGRLALVLLIAVIALVFLVPVVRRPKPEQTGAVTNTHSTPEITTFSPTPTPESSKEDQQPSRSPLPKRTQPNEQNVKPHVAQRFPPQNEVEPFEPSTRTLSLKTARKQLREVRLVFIRVEGPEDLAIRIRPGAEQALTSGGAATKIGDMSNADAHLIIHLTSTGTSVVATAQLVTRDGRVIWPLRAGPPIERSFDAIEEIGSEIGKALANDIKVAIQER